eukprot:TRINITY_DN2251_c0_g4_i1.p1 TRINITY_DN2251_c0_g4~~TRINITY_DN2251_c0_g4_i1.p1  ORF type:complete len:329 (-),score=123.83 TRINITY_DN2251_c0_g4_i1:213-1199(-)
MLRCPVCRATHERHCGQRLYIEANCPVCFQLGSPFVALPCRHGLCDACLGGLGGALVLILPSGTSRSLRQQARRNAGFPRGSGRDQQALAVFVHAVPEEEEEEEEEEEDLEEEEDVVAGLPGAWRSPATGGAHPGVFFDASLEDDDIFDDALDELDLEEAELQEMYEAQLLEEMAEQEIFEAQLEEEGFFQAEVAERVLYDAQIEDEAAERELLEAELEDDAAELAMYEAELEEEEAELQAMEFEDAIGLAMSGRAELEARLFQEQQLRAVAIGGLERALAERLWNSRPAEEDDEDEEEEEATSASAEPAATAADARECCKGQVEKSD